MFYRFIQFFILNQKLDKRIEYYQYPVELIFRGITKHYFEKYEWFQSSVRDPK